MNEKNVLNLEDRKLDHIKVCANRNVESRMTTLLENVLIEHVSLPEMDLDDVDVSMSFLGKKISAPIMISAMTGGHPATAKINAELAEIAERQGIPIGVGSQRAAIENPRLSWTFKIVREKAPSVPVIANLGAPQLSKKYTLREAEAAVQMIEADALAIHLNPLQEAFQPEGDNWYRNVLEKIKEIRDTLPVPVIVKETGTGISYTVAKTAYELGIRYFDISGLGGTNWGKVEAIRAALRGLPSVASRIDGFGDFWGVPTALSVILTRIAAPQSTIIASGGIRDGLDVAKSIALGADLAGLALPLLRILLKEGASGLESFIKNIIYQVKVATYLSGSKDLTRLKCKPGSFLVGTLNELAKQNLKNIHPKLDIAEYITRLKCTNSLEVPEGWRI